MTRSTMLTALVAAALLVGGNARAQCVPIQFARGQSSVVVRGMAPSDEPFTCFTLVAGRGQSARLRLTQSNGDTAFNIAGLTDNRYDHSFVTEAKQYRIDVYQMRSGVRPAPFSLEVSVR